MKSLKLSMRDSFRRDLLLLKITLGAKGCDDTSISDNLKFCLEATIVEEKIASNI